MPAAPQSKALARQAQRRRQRRSLWTIALAIALSLGVHLALLPMPRRWFFASGPVAPPPPMMVDLQPPPPKPRPRPRVRPRPPPPQGPIVDAPPTKDTHVPDNARFRSEHNTHVKKETVAANPGQGALAAVPTPSAGKGKPHPASKASKKQAHKAKAKAAKKQVAKKTEGAKQGSKAAATKRTLPVNDGARLLAMNKQRPKDADKPPKKSDTQGPQPVLMPDLDQMAHAVGGARADQIPGVQLGTQTWLNSRQFKYASFWNRIRSLAGQAWEPLVRRAMRIHDPEGHQAGGDAKVSVVGVTLDGEGQVQGVEVTRSSGREYLDRAALNAFREVGRFPNPPPPLVGPDGHIRFEFAFILNFTPPSVAGP